MIWMVIVLGSVGFGWLLGHGDAPANLRRAADSLPQNLLGALLGITVGLYRRERIRLRRTYASPTMAYLGKGLLFAAVSAAATAVFAPVAWPPLVLALCAGLIAVGVSVWLGNLPSRL
jgi:hypothetical protein